MELELKFKSLGEVKNGATWVYQMGIFETLDENYPKPVAVQFWKEPMIAALEQLEVDNTYILSCNVASNESKGNWYTNLSCWKVKNPEMEQTATQIAPQTPAPPKKTTPTATSVKPVNTAPQDHTDDDLPY